MCGRFSFADPERLREFSILEKVPRLEEPVAGLASTPRYNIAPSQLVAAVRRVPGDGDLRIDFLHWGLLPPWAPDRSLGSRLINARRESLARKTAFREAFRERRCLVLADGFFEWRREGRVRQPYHVTTADRAMFTMAGLWERWRAPDGEIIDSCTVITRPALAPVLALHDRMPVLVDAKDHARWLDRELHDPVVLRAILDADPPPMTLVAVSTRVNKPDFDDPSCLERASVTLPLNLG